jgi:hypothetical protein
LPSDVLQAFDRIEACRSQQIGHCITLIETVFEKQPPASL